jgi:hypothetical protein
MGIRNCVQHPGSVFSFSVKAGDVARRFSINEQQRDEKGHSIMEDETMTAEVKTFWLTAVQKVGFPIVAAGVFMYAFWDIGNRVADGHVKYLHDQVEIGQQNVKSMQGIAEAVTAQSNDLSQSRKTLEAQGEQLRDIAKELRDFRREQTPRPQP